MIASDYLVIALVLAATVALALIPRIKPAKPRFMGFGHSSMTD